MERTRTLSIFTPLHFGIVALLASCTSVQSPTQNQQSALDANLKSNTGQNTQIWPDGSSQTGSTQLDSGLITPESTNWMGTAVSGVIALNKNGVQIKNPGNLEATTLSIEFGDPIVDEYSGQLVLPLKTLQIEGLTNEVTSVIDASSVQVELWANALVDLSDDQREAILRALERDEVLATETIGAIRAALEAAVEISGP